jgi:succinate-semialdehyde dehydrogenase/glutarate-semialdehyde dehydrogenase
MPNHAIQSTLKDAALLQTDAWINGQWVGSQTRFAVSNPATGEELAQVANVGVSDVNAAITAAEAALPAWRALTGKERSIILRRWFDLIVANSSDLARILTLEQGKPLAEAKGEVAYGASFLEWFAE